MFVNFYLIPIIKSGAADGFFVKAEAYFADEMQGRIRR